MALEENNWAQTGTILGIVFAVLAGCWKFIAEMFKDRRALREANILSAERQQSASIRQAVKEGMESFNQEIRREFKEYKAQTDRQFETVNKRIDDVMNKLDR